jgi:hypothetical protein
VPLTTTILAEPLPFTDAGHIEILTTTIGRFAVADDSTHNGRCFCGAVEIQVTGEPAAMGYCHCTSCREWSAGPVNALSLWAPDAVKVIAGAENIASYQKTEKSIRKWCRVCGGHIMTEHPLWGVTDVYAAAIPNLPFHGTIHVNYQETVLHMRDGLPKQRDMPAEMGGSGELVAE